MVGPGVPSPRAWRKRPAPGWAAFSASLTLIATTTAASPGGMAGLQAEAPDTPIVQPDSPFPSACGHPPPLTQRHPLKSPSTLPDIIRDRVQQIETALQSTPTPGVLAPETVARLSDHLLLVNPWGELELEFHSAGRVGPAQMADLTALGATILLSTGEVIAAPGPSPLGPQIIVARIAHCQVEAAAALPWVAAVQPVERTPPDRAGSTDTADPGAAGSGHW